MDCSNLKSRNSKSIYFKIYFKKYTLGGVCEKYMNCLNNNGITVVMYEEKK